jgi:hypothetical protein
MYYQEKIINGVLMFKTTPNGDWKPISPEELTKRLQKLQKVSLDLYEALKVCSASLGTYGSHQIIEINVNHAINQYEEI